MQSGFITPTKTIKRAGIHQRFDMAAYRMIEPYLPASFPSLKQIIHFEGYNGPDGLKVKHLAGSGPSHMYDPVANTGEVPRLVMMYYRGLVDALKAGDTIRAAFEAAWMAHYLGDGLTPAHHWPFDEEVHAAHEIVATVPTDARDLVKLMAHAKKTWALWGFKGTYTTHFNFENGIMIALIVVPIRPKFDEAMLANARRVGALKFFRQEAIEVSKLGIYEHFVKSGWTNDTVRIIRNQLAPHAAAVIGYVWLLAVLEAGQELAIDVASLNS